MELQKNPGIQDQSAMIKQTLNRLGLLEGIYHLEQNSGLFLNKNLFLSFSDDCLETQIVAYNVVWNEKNNTYTIHTQVLAFSETVFATKNLDSVFKFLEYSFKKNDVNSRKFFLDYLSKELVCYCYKIWKNNFKLLFAPFSSSKHPYMPLLYPNFIGEGFEIPIDSPFWESASEAFAMFEKKYARFFNLTKDVVLGIYTKTIGKRTDRACWKWGIQLLIERIFRNSECREMKIWFGYGNSHRIPIHENVQCRLGKAVLGARMLGDRYSHVCGDIEIHLTTPSLEIYLALYPGGEARNFLNDVISFWFNVSLANMIHKYYKISWKIQYTGPLIKSRIASKKGYDDPSLERHSLSKEGLFRLGYSTWL